jgi:hypothetical protein
VSIVAVFTLKPPCKNPYERRTDPYFNRRGPKSGIASSLQISENLNLPVISPHLPGSKKLAILKL